MVWIQVRPKMALKDKGSSIIVKGTRAMIGPAATGNIPPRARWFVFR